MKALLPHHFGWLKVHPHRSHAWLLDRLADGFHVHHIDKDHSNNDPGNLILIEGQDHLDIFHGMKNVKLHVFDPNKKDASPDMIARSKAGGIARAKKLGKRARRRIASHAARMRWGKRK